MFRIVPLDRPRRASALLLALVVPLVVAACSSPTSPTSRPPSGNTTPPGPTINPLSLTCPANQTITSPDGNPVFVTFTAAVAAGGAPPIQTSCTRVSGVGFPVGTTSVQCTATDARAETRSCTFTVTVLPPPPRVALTRFLAFGDSMTAGEVSMPAVTASTADSPNYRLVLIPSASYPTQLLSLLRARYTAQTAQLSMTNSGWSGEWAEDGALRLPGVMSTVRPEAVLLLEGRNDLAALGTPGVQRAWRALDTMAKEIRGRGARTFIATLPPQRTTGTLRVSQADLESLNNLIRTTARGEGAVLVDLYAALSTDINRFIGVDGAHPTEAGYQKIAETFFAAIRQDLERQ